MPEREFDLYLSLLSRFLKLNPSQRGEISEELRTHLEDRLEELAARGLSREQAIHTALEELGDAAELAQHFTRAAHIRRRRFIMRCTYGTVAALVAALLVGTAFWPQTQGVLPVAAVAKDETKELSLQFAVAPPVDKRPQNAVEERIVASLGKPTEVAFQETAFEDAVRYLKEFHSINIILDRAAMIDEGISLDTPISIDLAGVTFKSVLKLMLEPLGLTYVIEDEVMKITTAAKAVSVIHVYNVRDLAAMREPGDAAVAAAPEAMGMGMGMDMGMGMGMAPAGGRSSSTSNPCGNTLASVISRTISPGTWSDNRDAGSVIEYKGLLVVKHTPYVHDKVKALLELMRESSAIR